MEIKEIEKIVAGTVANELAKVELSAKLKELDALKEENKSLRTKLSDVEDGIPSEKVEEITEIVEKAVGEKVDSIVGEKLAEIVEKVDELENSMTNRERISKALSSKTAFKPMSRPSKAYTEGADVDVQKELEAITEKLKSAKDKKSLEEVKNLLQAFVSSSVKTKLSAESEDLAELEAYRELGSIDEIEAAVEVLEVYADEIGTLPELEVEGEEFIEDTEADSDINIFASKRKKAMISARKRVKATKKTSMASRAKRVRELKAKSVALAGLKSRVKENMQISSASKEVPGSLASSLFSKK